MPSGKFRLRLRNSVTATASYSVYIVDVRQWLLSRLVSNGGHEDTLLFKE